MIQLVRFFRRAGLSSWWLLASLAACQTNRAAFQLPRVTPSVSHISDEPASGLPTTDTARLALVALVVQQPASPTVQHRRQPKGQPSAPATLRRPTSMVQPFRIKEITRLRKKISTRNSQQPADALDGVGRLLVLIGVGCLLLFVLGLASGSAALAIISGVLLLLFAVVMVTL